MANPTRGIHAVQMELAIRGYADEDGALAAALGRRPRRADAGQAPHNS